MKVGIFWAIFSIFSFNSSKDDMKISYETYSQKVDIQNNVFTVIVTEYTYDNPVSATPSGSSSRVVADNVRLSKENGKKLDAELSNGEFFNLPDTLGAPEGERYYPETLTVRFAKTEKTVFYRSNPAYPAPEAFARLAALVVSCTNR